MLMYMMILQCIRPSASQPCQRCKTHHDQCTRNIKAKEYAQHQLNSEQHSSVATTLDTARATSTLLHPDKFTFPNAPEVRPNAERDSDADESESAPTENAEASTRLDAGAVFSSLSGISSATSQQHSEGPILSGSVSMTGGPEYSNHPTTSLDTMQIGYPLFP